ALLHLYNCTLLTVARVCGCSTQLPSPLWWNSPCTVAENTELPAQTFPRHRNDPSTPQRNNFSEGPLKIISRAPSLSDSLPSNHTNRIRPVSEQNFNVERQVREFHEKALILKRLKDLTKEIRYVTGRMHHKDAESRTSNEWRLACRVLDRLCLIVFAALNLFTTLGILTSAPTIIKAFTTTGAPSQPIVLRIDRSIDDSVSVSDAASSVDSPNRYVNHFTASPLKLETAAVRTNTEGIGTSTAGRRLETWTNNINDMEFEFRPKILKNISQKSHLLEREIPFSDRIELRNLVAPTFLQRNELQQVPGGQPRRHLTTHVLDEGSYSSGMEYACAAESNCQENTELPAQTFPRHRNDPSTPQRNNFSEGPLKIISRAPSLSDSLPSNHTNRIRPVSEQNFNVERQVREFHEKALILKRLKDLTKEIRYVTGRMHHKDAESRTSNEWRLACRVLDRLCLIVFAALNLFTTLGILTSAPTIIKAFTTTGAPSQP
ncbi:hypothetical protein X801_05831, partial [Opisthorchis viverrini]